MNVINNGKLGSLSVMGLGCWNLGGQWGETFKEDAIRIIRKAIDNGVTFVDVAESYGVPEGECELLLGKALKDGYREKVKIISKVGWYAKRDGKLCANNLFEKVFRQIVRMYKPYWLAETRTPELIKLSGFACCGRMRINNIDVLLCHDGLTTNLEPFVKGFDMLKADGVIKQYGISTDNVSNLKSFYNLSEGQCAVCEFDYSLINREAEKELIPFCVEKGITMLTRGSLSSGLLSGRYTRNTNFKDSARAKWNGSGKRHNEFIEKMIKVEKLINKYGDNLPEIAYKYVFSQTFPMSVVMGCTSMEQLNKNLKTGESFLSHTEMDEINKLLLTL